MAFTGFGVVAQTEQLPRSAWLRKQAGLVLLLALLWRLGGAHLLRRDEVSRFLHELELEQYVGGFHNQGFEQLTELSHVTDTELRDHLGVTLLGHRKRILSHLALLHEAALQPSVVDVAIRWALFAATAATATTAATAAVGGLILYQAPQLRKSLLESITVFGLLAWYNTRKLTQTNGLPDWACHAMLHAERVYALINGPPSLGPSSRSASFVSMVTAPTPSDAGDALTPTALTLGDPSTTPSAVDKPRRKWSLGRRASSKELNRTGSK